MGLLDSMGKGIVGQRFEFMGEQHGSSPENLSFKRSIYRASMRVDDALDICSARL